MLSTSTTITSGFRRSYLLPLVIAGSLLFPRSSRAQSDWTVTTDRGTLGNLHRWNISADTLWSGPADGETRAGRLVVVGTGGELRRENPSRFWLGALVGAGIAGGTILLSPDYFDGAYGAVGKIFLVGALMSTGGAIGLYLGIDEVHELSELDADGRRMVIGARLPVALGENGKVERFDGDAPTGRRVSNRSWWGDIGAGMVRWSDGEGGGNGRAAGSYWLDEHLMTVRYVRSEAGWNDRLDLSLLYGRGLTFDWGYATAAAGPGYYRGRRSDTTGITGFDGNFDSVGLSIDASLIFTRNGSTGFGLAALGGWTVAGGGFGGMMLTFLFGDID